MAFFELERAGGRVAALSLPLPTHLTASRISMCLASALLVLSFAGCGSGGGDAQAAENADTSAVVEMDAADAGETTGAVTTTPVVKARTVSTTSSSTTLVAQRTTASSTSTSKSPTTTTTTTTTTTAAKASGTTTSTSTPTTTATTTSGLTLTAAGMRSDMNGAHESTILGVPPEWSWGSQPDPGYGLTGFPAHWTQPAYTNWGVVGPAASGSPARNVRVQIRHLRADFKRNGSWYRAQFQASGFSGANYTDYSTNASSPADIRNLGSDGIAVKIINAGGHFHFYPNSRVTFYRDLQALVVAMEVRLIKDDPNGVDDLDQAKIYGVSAGDIYQSATAQWNGTVWVNGHAPIGRFRQITRNWRVITANLGLSSDAQFNEYIAWAARQ